MVRINRYKAIALDSNVFIYYFNKHPEFGQKAKYIIDSLTANQIKAVTSEVAAIELLSHPILFEKDALDMDKQFLDIPNLKIMGIDHSLALEAAKIRREYGFRLPDAIQLATALCAKAKAFITNDDKLKKFKEIKIILLSEIK